MIRRFAFSLPLTIIAGCVYATLTPQGEGVRITANPEAVRGCELVGPVEGGDGWNGGIVGQRAAEQNAVIHLRNNAAELGADVVLMVTDLTGPSGSTQRGEGYDCGSP